MTQIDLTDVKVRHLYGALQMTITKLDEMISDGTLIFPGRKMAELMEDAKDFAKFRNSLESILTKLPDEL